MIISVESHKIIKCKKVLYSLCPAGLQISMYQGTEMAFENALLLGFLQSAKTSNLRALLARSENALLGNIFTSFCCNCDTKHACKRSF